MGPNVEYLFEETGNDLSVDATFVGSYKMLGGSNIGKVMPPSYEIAIRANMEYGSYADSLRLVFSENLDGINRLNTLIKYLEEARRRLLIHSNADVDVQEHIEILESLGYQVLPPRD